MIPENAKPEELFNAALSSLRNENPAQAVQLLKRLTELEPKHKQAWNTLGFAYFSAQSYDEAITAFQKQIELNAYDENAYRNLGLVYQRQQKYAEAVEALRKQLEVKPLDKPSQSILGIVLRESKKYDEAAVELEKAISLDPETAALHVNLGQTYLNLKKNEEALAAFDKAVELEPAPTTWNNVAYELSVHNVHLERALQYAESAVASIAAELRNVELARVTMNDMRKVSALASYWDTLGWIHFQAGDLDKAEKYCRASWLLDFHGEVGDHLGQIYEKRGNKDAAAKMYALAAVATRPIPETRGRLAAITDQKARAQLEQNAARDLSREFTLPLDLTLASKGSAEVALSIVPGTEGPRIEAAAFVRGDERLRPAVASLRATKLPEMFPGAVQTKVIRRGTLQCGFEPKCSLVLLAADKVTSVE